MITHDIDEAIELGDQVAILSAAVLAQVGTPQQLLEEPVDAFVEGFVGKDRGYRALSFQPAHWLEPRGVRCGDAEAGAPGERNLLLDADAALGWADPTRPGYRLPLGATF